MEEFHWRVMLVAVFDFSRTLKGGESEKGKIAQLMTVFPGF